MSGQERQLKMDKSRRFGGFTNSTSFSRFKAWATWIRNSGWARVTKVADMIESRPDDVISYCKHPITSGLLEGMNSIIMAIQRAGRGYRHTESFGIVIMFFCGGLDMAPI